MIEGRVTGIILESEVDPYILNQNTVIDIVERRGVKNGLPFHYAIIFNDGKVVKAFKFKKVYYAKGED